MEKKNKPVARKGLKVKNKLNKIITFFTCLVLILVSLFIYPQVTYGIGYKYYENNTIQIGITQEKDTFNKTLDEYFDELEQNGFYVYSIKVNKNITNKITVIRKDKMNEEELHQNIRNSVDVTIFATKLILNDEDIYYFKSETDCEDFIDNINKYDDNIVIDIENDIIDINEITAEKILEDKIEEYHNIYNKKQAEKIAATEAMTKRQEEDLMILSSRGDINRDFSFISQAPLDSYTCISSYFGQRGGSFHTGVDFATPTGTEVYA